MIKLIATDIDGTILTETNEFRPKILETIEKIKAKGVKLVLATGRVYNAVAPVAAQLGLDTPIICTQGSLLKNNNEILWSAPVDHDLALDVIKFLRNKGVHTNFYNNDNVCVEDDRYMDDYTGGRFIDYKIVDRFENLNWGMITKLLAIVYDDVEIQKLEDELKERYKGKLGIVRSSATYLEITNPEASKGNALKKLMEMWNLAPDEVLTSGDQDNDIELLKVAGVRVAMKNASKKLKEVANYIAPDVHEDGWAEAIERFVLCE